MISKMTPLLAALRRRGEPSPQLIVTAIMLCVGLLAAYAVIALAGTKTGMALALLCVAGPVALYAAIFWPQVFPFGLFVFLVPFDNLLVVSSLGTLTKFLAIASTVALVAWMLRTRRFVTPDRSVLAWGALMAWMLLSLIWAIDPQEAYGYLATSIGLFTLYAVASFFPVTASGLRMILLTVMASGVAAAVYGGFVFGSGRDIAGGGRLFLSNDASLTSASSFINPDHFGASMIVPFALILGVLSAAKNLWVRVFCTIGLSAVTYGVAISGSRGALLAIGLTFLYMAVRSRHRLALAALGLGGVAVAIALNPSILMRFGNATSTGGAGRADIWKVGIAAFRHYWLIGAGYANFPNAFDQNFLSVSQAYYTHWHRVSHNDLIGVAVELGIVGLAIFLGAWVMQFRALRRIPPEHPLYSIRVSLEASIIGLFAASFFLNTMTQKYIWLTFIVIALTRNCAFGQARRPAAPSLDASTTSGRFG